MKQYVQSFLLRSTLVVLIALIGWSGAQGQMIPNEGENIDFLVTFGNATPKKWGDDDFTQVFFFLVPNEFTEPVYLRVFDPEVGGKYDQANRSFNTRTTFSIYGGKGAHSCNDCRKVDPVGDYKSGILLDSRTFAVDPELDDNWYTFGPLNPSEGEADEFLKGHIFKVIIQGISGDDGNCYRMFLSDSPDRNNPILDGNGFTYEYSFRLSRSGEVAQLYPYVDEQVVSIKQNNFDFDRDGYIKLYSVAKNGHFMTSSADNQWQQSQHRVVEAEKGKSMNIQIVKTKSFDNDMVFYVTNQYDQPMPFFAVPIGGPPKYKYSVDIVPDKR